MPALLRTVGPPLRRLWSAFRWIALHRTCPSCAWPLAFAPTPACRTCAHAPVDYPTTDAELRALRGDPDPED